MKKKKSERGMKIAASRFKGQRDSLVGKVKKLQTKLETLESRSFIRKIGDAFVGK
jgi:hypothetical protein